VNIFRETHLPSHPIQDSSTDHFQEDPEVTKNKKPILQKKKEKNIRNILGERKHLSQTTNPKPTC